MAQPVELTFQLCPQCKQPHDRGGVSPRWCRRCESMYQQLARRVLLRRAALRTHTPPPVSVDPDADRVAERRNQAALAADNYGLPSFEIDTSNGRGKGKGDEIDSDGIGVEPVSQGGGELWR